MSKKQEVTKQPSFRVAITSEAYQKMINDTLGNPKKAERFTSSIITAVSSNPSLQECERGSIITSALQGEALQLSPSPQMGHFYMVPFKNNKLKIKQAQFQLGYKGYIQLAIRSGQYKKINVVAIKEGELISYDQLSETIEVKLIDDELKREKAKTIGYYAMFELVNGFVKSIYWTKEKMEAHATKYSQGYASDKRNNTNYTFWSKDFDGMAYKTMLRQLISKWGIMTIDLQQAYESDMAVINEDKTYTYVDHEDNGRSNEDEIIEQNDIIDVETGEIEEVEIEL